MDPEIWNKDSPPRLVKTEGRRGLTVIIDAVSSASPSVLSGVDLLLRESTACSTGEASNSLSGDGDLVFTAENSWNCMQMNGQRPDATQAIETNSTSPTRFPFDYCLPFSDEIG